MSKAGEWAKRETARIEALEEAQRKIEREMDAPSPDRPPIYIHRGSPLASVQAYDRAGSLRFRDQLGSPIMNAVEALNFAGWILAVFSDEPPA